MDDGPHPEVVEPLMSTQSHADGPASQGCGPTNLYRPFLSEDTEQSIPARFAQQVQQHPGKAAIETANQTLTYEELYQAANRLAVAILDARAGRRPDCLAGGMECAQQAGERP